MVPDPAEIAVLVFICLAITGLLKLDTLGEWVWRLRCACAPSIEQSAGGSGPKSGSSEGPPRNETSE